MEITALTGSDFDGIQHHAGCVLGFKHIETLSTPLLEAKPVAYSAEQPIVGSGLDFLLYGDTVELVDRTIRAVCYTKKSSWSYEREWRAITWRRNEDDRQHGDYSFYSEELESVTFGARILPSMEAQMSELLSSMYSSTKLYRMRVANGELVRSEA